MTPKAHRFLYHSQSEALQSTRSFSTSSQIVDPGKILHCAFISPADCPLPFAPALHAFPEPFTSCLWDIVSFWGPVSFIASCFQVPNRCFFIHVDLECACHCWTDSKDTLNNYFKWFLWPENTFCANMNVFAGCCRTCSGFIFLSLHLVCNLMTTGYEKCLYIKPRLFTGSWDKSS